MEFTIDQILLMQHTMIDVRRRTQELTISEIVSREIDPVLFILLLKLVSASHPFRTDSGPPVTPFPIGTGGGA